MGRGGVAGLDSAILRRGASSSRRIGQNIDQFKVATTENEGSVMET
jgi:hypothetical protein